MKRLLGAAAALCCLLTAAGCAEKPAADDPVSAAESYTALPGVDLAALLTADEIAGGLGCRLSALAEPLVYDDGAAVRFSDDAYTVTLDVHVRRPSEELRRYALDSCAGWETAPNLGDAAYFDRETVTLTAFFGAYILTVNMDAEAGASERLIAERHFAALIGERLLSAANAA